MLLICSAWKEEIKPLRELAPKNVQIESLGIGFLDAALNLERLITKSDKQIEKVIFIGTAGSYGDYSNEIVEVASTELLNIGSITGFSYLAQHGEDKLYEIKAPLFSLPKAHCLTTLEITTDETLAQTVANVYPDDYLVENLELFGIAKVCEENGIPWNAILGITNKVHEEAHQEWLDNNERVSELVCKEAFKLLNSLPSMA